MSAPASGRLTQSLSIQASVSYDVLAQTQPDGTSTPVLIGSGKFAKVYKAWQRSARRNVRPVAVKILHDHATLADERLFKQEIDLLKELTTVRSVNVIRTLDIVRVPPLARSRIVTWNPPPRVLKATFLPSGDQFGSVQ